MKLLRAATAAGGELVWEITGGDGLSVDRRIGQE